MAAGMLGHFDHLTKLLEREHKMMVMLATRCGSRIKANTTGWRWRRRRGRRAASFGYIDADGEPVGQRPWERHK